jgi:uncharacterized protein (TIRG00374 family)
MTRKKKRNLWRIMSFVAMTALIVAVFVWLVDWPAVGQVLRTADITYLLLASLALVAGLLAFAWRWRVLLANKPSLLHTFHASNIGHAGNMLIPGRAGEPARIVVMGQDKSVSITTATSSFVVERLFEQIMRLLALGAAVLSGVELEGKTGTVVGGIVFLVVAFVGIAWLVRHQETVLQRGPKLLAKIPRLTEERAKEWLADFMANLQAVSEWRRLAAVSAASLVTWGCFWGFFYLTLLALGDGFPPEQRLPVSLGALALSPPSAATQPGLFHASVVAPLTAVGFARDTLTAYAILLHILEMIWITLLAVWGMVQLGVSFKELFGEKKAAKAA